MPLFMKEELTGSKWTITPIGTQPFTFASYFPGIYTLNNRLNGNLNVQVFGQTYTMIDKSTWRFIVDENLLSYGTAPGRFVQQGEEV